MPNVYCRICRKWMGTGQSKLSVICRECTMAIVSAGEEAEEQPDFNCKGSWSEEFPRREDPNRPQAAGPACLSDEQLNRVARVVAGLSGIQSTLQLVRQDVEILLAEGVLVPSDCMTISQVCDLILGGLDEIQREPSLKGLFRLAAARLRSRSVLHSK